MGGGETKLEGPDLTGGVPASSLKDGEPLLGHAEGEPVMLVRKGDEVFAIGAQCTHYGGPLAEGLVEGDTVRCPWHHACFSLRDGEAVRPPALDSVSAWNVIRRGDVVAVSGRRTVQRTRTPKVSPKSIVIVGAGAAGAVAAHTLREYGYDGPVTTIDPDPDEPCDRPNLSKDYLAGNAPEEWIALRPPDYFRERNIDRLHAEVTSIDPAAKTVSVAGGTSLTYDALLLATGAEPIRLNLPADGARVFYLRTVADSRAIIAAAEKAGRAAVIGASFIGLEVAASLRARGVEVSVIAPEDVPLARVMGDDLGRFIRSLHESKGVRFHLGRTARALDNTGVTLDDGTRVTADLVVIGVGVRPRDALARAAGLEVDNGVIVNARLETSAPGIWAAGDIARYPDPRTGEPVRIEHWVVAERMGQAAALNMLGEARPYVEVPFFWSQHYDVTIAYVGHASRWDKAELDGDPEARDCTVTFRRDGRTLALATIFRDRESLAAEVAMAAEARAAAG